MPGSWRNGGVGSQRVRDTQRKGSSWRTSDERRLSEPWGTDSCLSVDPECGGNLPCREGKG